MAQAKIGYAAMLEQFAPGEVLDLCAQAEAAGFSGVMAADHFQPWTPQQGQASFVWEVLAVAGARTRGDEQRGEADPEELGAHQFTGTMRSAFLVPEGSCSAANTRLFFAS